MANKEELEAMGISNHYNTNSNNGIKKTNNVATIIKVLGILEFVGGLIVGISFIDKFEELSIIFIVVGIVFGIFIYALGEIIQLLQDIKNK